MTKITLNGTWKKVVDADQSYLLQSMTDGKYIVANVTTAPLDNLGFTLDCGDSLSSAAYPATAGIWAKTVQGTIELAVDSWE